MVRDLTGLRFGRLLVTGRAPDHIQKSGGRKTMWYCTCDCGNVTQVMASNLLRGNSQSCGCKNREELIGLSTTHNQRYTRLYGVWTDIKTRCYNPKSSSYARYGARGILMCDEWRSSFEAFADWAYSNGYDESADRGECTIDRIDVNGYYCPENCRFTNAKKQANNRRNTLSLTINGETHTLAEWAEKCQIDYHTLYARITKLHWTPERALNLI